MKIQAFLDFAAVAVEQNNEVTVMADITAPINEAHLSRPSQGAMMCVDRSGSMEGAPLEAAKEACLKLFSRLAPQDYFGLVAFDDAALVIVPFKKVSDHNAAQVKHAISTIESGGSTDISAGYLLAVREVERAEAEGGSTILLISDGQANAGECTPDFFTSAASTAAQKKITTTSIGFGNDYDEILLAAVAKGGNGSHRFAATVDEAIGVLSSEISNLLNKSAVNVALRVRPSAMTQGHPLIEIINPLPHWIDNGDYVIQLGDLYGGENRRFLIKFIVPGVESLGLCHIADLKLEYLDLNEKKEKKISVPVMVNVLPGDEAKGLLPDPIVYVEKMIIEAQDAKLKAIHEINNGLSKEASARLRKTAASLRRKASEIKAEDDRAVESLKLIREEADAIENLAQDAINHDRAYTSKRMTESFAQRSRSRSINQLTTDNE